MFAMTFASLTMLGMFGFPGAPELMIVLLIALVLFGGAKLPSLMRNLGKSANEFKRGMAETADDTDDAANKSEKV